MPFVRKRLASYTLRPSSRLIRAIFGPDDGAPKRDIMSAIDRIIQKLSKYPGVKFGRAGNRIEIEKPNPGGFPLSFVEEEKIFSVYFGSNRCHFDKEEEALDYLAFGLSRKCRLREIVRGSPHKWIVEQEFEDGWKAMNEMGLIFFQFWRKKRENVYQNTLFT
jgi:hypothetical protein